MSLLFASLRHHRGTSHLSYSMLTIVVALHKKGDMSKVDNYRPISLCSVVCKLMESIINSQLLIHLETHKLLSDNQFGFRKTKFCSLQLLKYVKVNGLSSEM